MGLCVSNNQRGKLLAARISVYAGEDDEYFTFLTPEAYLSLESWDEISSRCGEYVTKDSWLMRDLWNAAKTPTKRKKKERLTTQLNYNLLVLRGLLNVLYGLKEYGLC